MAHRIRWLIMLGVFALMSAACSSSDGSSTLATASEPPSLSAVPDDVRVSNGGGQPRSAGYWTQWSTCGPDSRAETAAANGGAQAGWYLVDDLLAEPGIDLGDQPVVTCETAVNILAADDLGSWDGLARQLLAAELSLNIGAENCEVAEQTAAAAQLTLSRNGYSGPGSITAAVDDATLQLVELLGFYGSGELCR